MMIAIILAVVLGMQPPDFSGHWVGGASAAARPAPGAPPPAPRGEMGSGWGDPITITQTASELVVEQPIFSRYDLQPPLRFVFRLDGQESRNTVMAGHETQTRTSRASWEGQTLVIVTSFPGIDPDSGKAFTTLVTQRLTLESPTQLLIEVVRSGVLGGRETRSQTLFLKNQ
jgi:hypothetical protein